MVATLASSRRATTQDAGQLTLVSHHLCPYVQRAAIALEEKGVAFERVHVDLADKPTWFERLSPLGKVPLLLVGAGEEQSVLFESAVILEYLEETRPHPLHPAHPIARARHRGWMEFGSAILNGVARFYNVPDEPALTTEARRLAAMFERVEAALGDGPWFAGYRFSLVDAVFAPIFRYFDTFDAIGDFGIFAGTPRVAAWRRRLADRPSVRNAVAPDYPERLRRFLRNRQGALSLRIESMPVRASA